ncbi:MAG: hypothetical protein II748_03070 [Clostridia bacterium]|nr:hypothetical protein [Clostridia bacterium]
MNRIPIPLLFAISMTVNLLCSVFRKIYTGKTDNKPIWQYFFLSITSFVSLAIFLLWGGVGEIHNVTLWLGLLYGVIMAVQLLFYMLAVGCGSFAFTTIIVSLGSLLPALSGPIFYGEGLSVFQIIGAVLMVIALILSAGKDTKSTRPSVKWLIIVAIAFILAPCVGFVQKAHQETEWKSEINGFLILAFSSATVLMLILFFVSLFAGNRKLRLSTSPEQPLRRVKMPFGIVFVILVVIAGALIAVNNKLNLYLSGQVDSIIFFPLVNGGAMVLNTLSGIIVFKEKPNLRMIMSLLLGTAALVLVCL